MKREIKFEIIYGCHTGDRKKRVWGLDELLNRSSLSYSPAQLWGEDYPVIAIRQYAGLKDRHGKEIYEGDILRKGEGLPMHRPEQKPKQEVVGSIKKVIFHEGCFQITKSNSSQNYRLSSVVIRYYGLEVIGNIYENSDLLSKEENDERSVATFS